MLPHDGCEVLGPHVARPRVTACEPWCVEHEDGVCASASFALPVDGMRGWLERDALHLTLITDGPKTGHMHISLDDVPLVS